MEGYYGIGEVFVKVANLEHAAAFYRYPHPKSPTNQEWLNEPAFLNSLPDRLKSLFDNWLKYG